MTLTINLKFFKPYEKKQHHSIYINCVKNEYWIFDEKENKWYYSCFPFSYNDGIEFYIPKNVLNIIKGRLKVCKEKDFLTEEHMSLYNKFVDQE